MGGGPLNCAVVMTNSHFARHSVVWLIQRLCSMQNIIKIPPRVERGLSPPPPESGNRN